MSCLIIPALQKIILNLPVFIIPARHLIISRCVEKHTEKREKCLVVGDFNFDFSSEEKHPIRTQMTSLKYEQLMKYPSHYAGSVLDLAYKKGKWDILKDKKLLCAYSDHFGLSVSIAKKVLTK